MLLDRQRTANAEANAKPLRILHVMRAPIGGLFRHVADLAGAQAERGHLVGIIADSSTGGERAETVLQALQPSLALGVTRLRMRRLPDWSDPIVAHHVAAIVNALTPDVVHGHGAKGGLYARLPALLPFFPKPRLPIIRAYTPHGGSLHYDPDTLVNRLYLAVEKALERVTDLIPFESDYVERRFASTIGLANAMSLVVPNGVRPEEFEPIAPASDAAEFLYVGEWRRFKGIDTLIEALSLIRAQTGAAPRLVLVGSGPDEAPLRALAEARGVFAQLSFVPAMPARDALRLGRILIVPSRAESLPYIVLEAIAACVPIVATKVGGIPQIFGPGSGRLIESDNPSALARAMIDASDMEPAARMRLCDELAEYVREKFSLATMADSVLRGYREAIEIAERRRSGADSAVLQRV